MVLRYHCCFFHRKLKSCRSLNTVSFQHMCCLPGWWCPRGSQWSKRVWCIRVTCPSHVRHLCRKMLMGGTWLVLSKITWFGTCSCQEMPRILLRHLVWSASKRKKKLVLFSEVHPIMNFREASHQIGPTLFSSAVACSPKRNQSRCGELEQIFLQCSVVNVPWLWSCFCGEFLTQLRRSPKQEHM